MADFINKKNLQRILIAVIILLAIFIFRYLTPYISGFLGAITLYVILRKQMIYLTSKKNWNRSLAAAVITIEALLLFLIPISGIGILVVDTLSGVKIDPDLIKNEIDKIVLMVESRVGFEIFTPENIKFVSKLGTDLVQTLATNLYSLVINAVVIAFVLYYMLYQRRDFESLVQDILPFSEINKRILVQETNSIILANAIGIPLLAIIQGIFAFAGYSIFGVNNPLLYAILTAFASLIPLLGTMIVWIPLAISGFIAGDYYSAIGIAVYGLVIIGGVDNVARFILQKKLADIHPLITVFGVLIGIPIFGFWGLIFGPLIISLLFLFINLYRAEFIPGSVSKPKVSKTNKDVKLFPFRSKNRKNNNNIKTDNSNQKNDIETENSKTDNL